MKEERKEERGRREGGKEGEKLSWQCVLYFNHNCGATVTNMLVFLPVKPVLLVPPVGSMTSSRR